MSKAKELADLRAALARSEEANAILAEGLNKSAALVSRLETKITSLTEEVARVRTWWTNSEENAKAWRLAHETLLGENKMLHSQSAGWKQERELLLGNLNRAEGWMNASRGLDHSGRRHPFGGEGAPELQDSDFAFMDKRGR